jgi:hypothetical protein
MGFFDVYDDTAYLNQIFSQNNIAAIDDYINQNGINDITNWKNDRGKDIASRWVNMPDDNSVTALLRAIGEPSPALELKKQWQQESRSQLRVQRQEQRRGYNATQNNYYGTVHYGDVVSGDKISIAHGDYIKGDKNIYPPPQSAEKQEAPDKPPAYIQYLIDKALLYPDGKHVIRSLDDVAAALTDFVNSQDDDQGNIQAKEIKITWTFLQDTFLQPDGKKYSEKSCKDALRMANYK